MRDRGFLKIISAGPGLTVQDDGRPGYQRYGLAESGAMDRLALAEGAALLGAETKRPLLEMFRMGGVFQAQGRGLRIALTGAEMKARIDDEPIAWNSSHLLPLNSRLVIGPAAKGVYGYLSIGGGIAVEPRMGSCSTHLRAGIGGYEGRPLKAGDLLPIGKDEGRGTGRSVEPLDRFCNTLIRVMWGPQRDMFSTAEQRCFLETAYTVTDRMDRMGVCLTMEGEPLLAKNHLSGVSDAVLHGDIQIAGNGRPVVLMADRPTTGGYPRIATVITADLPLFAQLEPGRKVGFRVVEIDEAVALLKAQQKELERLRERTFQNPIGDGSLAAPGEGK